MSKSGVAVVDACVHSFNELKLKKKYKFIIYKLNESNTEIVIEDAVEVGSYDDFVTKLPMDDCRYAVFDLEYELSSGEGYRNKILFIVWSPESAKIKQKMVYASSKDALKTKLQGVATEIQATDAGEISEKSVLERVRG